MALPMIEPAHSMNTRILLAFTAILFVAYFGIAQAQFDDFNDGNDLGWTHYEPLAAFGAGGTFTFPNGGYRIQSALSPDPDTVGSGRVASLRDDFIYAQVTVSAEVVDWDNSLDQVFGVLARLSDVGLGTTDGYALVYQPQDQDFSILRISGEIADTVESANLSLDPNSDYRFVFSLSGPDLIGEIFELANPAFPLVTLSAFDANYETGVAGLLVASDSPGNNLGDATFDNYFAAVPEPAMSAWLSGFLVFAGRRRRV